MTNTKEEDSTLLIIAASTNKKLSPSDIGRVLSSSNKRSSNNSREANVSIVYSVSEHSITSNQSSLVDRGANGGIAGSDVRVIDKGIQSVSVRGIDNHEINNLPIGTVGGVVKTQQGEVIAIFHQYAIFGKGNTIHSPAQMEWYKMDVNDKSVHVGGLQQIKTPDGYIIPLHISHGIPRLDLRPFTDKEWDELPHVIMTMDKEWDPSVLDHLLNSEENWFDITSHYEANPLQHAKYFVKETETAGEDCQTSDGEGASTTNPSKSHDDSGKMITFNPDSLINTPVQCKNAMATRNGQIS